MSSLELMRTPGYTDPELAEILARSPPPASLGETADVYALREILHRKKLAAAATAAAAGAADSPVTESDHQVVCRDGAHITVRVYRGAQSAGGPVMVMLHGGGWIMGGLENEDQLCKTWCKELSGVAINVDYRLAPEVKFPVPLYDCYDAVKWTVANPETHEGALSKGFIVAGISAGANMACVVSHLARDDGLLPKITGVYLSIPSLLSPQAVPKKWQSEYKSREELKTALILNTGAMALFRKLYEDDPLSPLMSPAVFSSHADLPPTYFQVAGSDPLRDEGLIYERVIREEADIPTKLDLYPGLPHGFWSWWPEAKFSQKHRADCVEGLRWLIEQKY